MMVDGAVESDSLLGADLKAWTRVHVIVELPACGEEWPFCLWPDLATAGTSHTNTQKRMQIRLVICYQSSHPAVGMSNRLVYWYRSTSFLQGHEPSLKKKKKDGFPVLPRLFVPPFPGPDTQCGWRER